MKQEKAAELRKHAEDIRYYTIKTIGGIGTGHIGGSLSVADLLAVLYFDKMNVDPKNPRMEGRDLFVMSKGHAGPAVYASLALKGFIPMEELETLNRPHTNLPSHCDMTKTPGIDMTAGSLGQGLSCAVGMAKAAKIVKGKEFIYCVVGDGESQEGQIWEAAMAAAHYKLDNLIVFLDNNKLQIDGTTEEVMSLADPVKKWDAFGFHTWEIDGHDVAAIGDAIGEAQGKADGKPSMIVLNTVKGKGVRFIEEAGAGNHSMTLSREQIAGALSELRGVK